MKFLILLILTIGVSAEAGSVPSGMALQGRLVKNEVPIEGSVTLTLSIMTPDTDACFLFEETHTLNLQPSDQGLFNVVIGSGARSVNDKGFSLSRVLSNDSVILSGLNCTGSSSTTFSPLPGKTRYVYLSFLTSLGNVSFSEPYILQSVPYAFEAEKLAGLSATDFLQTSTDTTQGKLDAIMSTSNYSELQALLGGSSIQYMNSSNSAPAKLPVLSTSPTSTTAGHVWFESGTLKFSDGSLIKNIVNSGGQTGSLQLGTTSPDILTLKTNDLTRVTILPNGAVGIGTTNPSASLVIAANDGATIYSGSGSTNRFPTFMIKNYIDTAPGGQAGVVIASSRGTSDSPSANNIADTIGSLLFLGTNDSLGSTNSGASIRVTAEEAFSSLTGGSSMRFNTTTVGSLYVSEKMRIAGNGNIGIGITNPAATLDVNGFFRLKRNSSAPASCSSTNDSAIAITSGYVACICKAGTGWVKLVDGSTTCSW